VSPSGRYLNIREEKSNVMVGRAFVIISEKAKVVNARHCSNQAKGLLHMIWTLPEKPVSKRTVNAALE
jgi:hypothetical protein